LTTATKATQGKWKAEMEDEMEEGRKKGRQKKAKEGPAQA